MGSVLNIIVSIPATISLLGGIGGTIWLICLGDWKFALCWFLIGLLAPFPIRWFHVLIAFLSVGGVNRITSGYPIFGYALYFLYRFLSYTIFYVWTIIAFVYVVGDVTTSYVIPSLLLAFSIVTQSTDGKGIKESDLLLIQYITILFADFFLALYIFFTGTDIENIAAGSFYTLFVFIIGLLCDLWYSKSIIEKQSRKRKSVFYQ